MEDKTFSPTNQRVAFKIALNVLCAEKMIQINDVKAAVGIEKSRFKNLQSAIVRPTDEELDAVEKAFPGFRDMYEGYLSGERGWGLSKTDALRERAVKSQENTESEAAYWRELFLKTNEELKKVLYESAKKDK